MNKIIPFISIALLLITGCTAQMEPQGHSQDVTLKVSIDGTDTKTYLDPDADAAYRAVYWSDGDVINVNGSSSEPLNDVEDKELSSIDFILQNIAAPFRAVYPDSIYSGCDENGSVSVVIPAVQEYCQTSFGRGAAVLYGYSESADQPMELKNLCGAIRIQLKDADLSTITKAVIRCNDKSAAIAGTFSINPQTGSYAAIEGVDSLALAFTEIALDSEKSSSFYFAVPYGQYQGGFTVEFYDADEELMECRWLKNESTQETEEVTIEAGRLYDFNPIEFETVKKEPVYIYYVWAADKLDPGFITGSNADAAGLSWDGTVVSQTFQIGTPALEWTVEATATGKYYSVGCVEMDDSVNPYRIKFGGGTSVFNPVKFIITPTDGFKVESITAYVSVNSKDNGYTFTAKVGDTVLVDRQKMQATKNPAAITASVEEAVAGDLEITINGDSAGVFYLYKLEITLVN